MDFRSRGKESKSEAKEFKEFDLFPRFPRSNKIPPIVGLELFDEDLQELEYNSEVKMVEPIIISGLTQGTAPIEFERKMAVLVAEVKASIPTPESPPTSCSSSDNEASEHKVPRRRRRGYSDAYHSPDYESSDSNELLTRSGPVRLVIWTQFID